MQKPNGQPRPNHMIEKIQNNCLRSQATFHAINTSIGIKIQPTGLGKHFAEAKGENTILFLSLVAVAVAVAIATSAAAPWAIGHPSTTLAIASAPSTPASFISSSYNNHVISTKASEARLKLDCRN